jgi:leader peptidase (prepilin peptidase)/N-methyltransferase
VTGPLFVFYLAALGVLGLLIGSFVNVVAYRVPIGMSVARPRSACPNCRTQIAARDNIPVISWILLRGRCRTCRIPIPDRYPLVEAMVAAGFVTVALWAWQPGTLSSAGQAPLINPLLPLLLILVSAGAALWLIDLDHLRLPDVIVGPLYPVALLGLLVAGWVNGDWPVGMGQALASAGVWLVVFGGIWLGSLGRAMGFGDVKLAPVLGLVLGWVGWGPSLVGLFAGFAVGAVVGVAMIIRYRAGRGTRVPYGPFMLAGALIGLLVGEPLWDRYLAILTG